MTDHDHDPDHEHDHVPEQGAGGAAEEMSAPTGRRRMLTALAGAAAGGVAGAALGQSGVAQAVDPNDIEIGSVNTGTTQTVLRRTAAASNNIFTATDSTGIVFGHISAYPAAVGGFGYGVAEVRNGVYGWSDDRATSGTNTGYGVVAGNGTDARAPLRLFSGRTAAPTSDTIDHAAGEVTIDGSGNFWVCVATGTPGTWRKIGGPASAGSFHPIDPIRAYDSRQAAYASSGMLRPNSSRVISVADAHDAVGAVTTVDAIPAGATAVTYNLTVAAPTGPNFLAVTPGDVATYTASSINFTAGQNVANGLTGKLDASRQMRVFGGDGPGLCHVLIDVNGYYL